MFFCLVDQSFWSVDVCCEWSFDTLCHRSEWGFRFLLHLHLGGVGISGRTIVTHTFSFFVLLCHPVDSPDSYPLGVLSSVHQRSLVTSTLSSPSGLSYGPLTFPKNHSRLSPTPADPVYVRTWVCRFRGMDLYRPL